jgi:hypothetical protein
MTSQPLEFEFLLLLSLSYIRKSMKAICFQSSCKNKSKFKRYLGL